MRALITGITGQDGGYLTDLLMADGYEVHGLVRPTDFALPMLLRRSPRVIAHTGDLVDSTALRGLVDAIEPNEIYNLGGISSVARSWEQPLLTAQVTGFAAAALLDAAWQVQQRVGREVRFMQASSAEMFGVPQESPQTEKTPLRPVSPYGAAKAYVHHLVGVYRQRGMHASACILFSHESPRRPESFVTQKIAKAAVQIASGQREMLSLGNLDARRDWGWAPDYVDAMVRATRYTGPGEYVIATGRTRSVRDFAAAAFAAAGVRDWDSRVVMDDRLLRPVEAIEQVGDASRARRQLGWEPTTSFEELVASMVRAAKSSCNPSS